MAVWQAGDIAIASVITNNATALTEPTGWTRLGSRNSSSGGGGNSIACITFYRVLDGSESSINNWGMGGSNPTWGITVSIYRGQHSTPVVAHSGITMQTSGNAVHAAVGATVNSDSWVFAATWMNSAFTLTTPPSGMTKRGEISGADEIELWDTNGGVSSWPGNSSAGVGGLWAVQTFELKAETGKTIQYIAGATRGSSGYGDVSLTLPAGANFSLNAVIVGGARPTHTAVEALLRPDDTNARVTHTAAEALVALPAPRSRATHSVVEALIGRARFLGSFGLDARLKGASHKGGSKNFGTTSVALNKPASTEEGDILIASISDNGGTAASVTPPAGWSLVGTRQTSGTTLGNSIYRYIVPASAPVTHTFNVTGAANSAGVIDAFHNVGDVEVVGQQVNASSTSVVAPSVSPTSTNSMLVFVGAVAANTSFTPPAGMTEDANTDQGTTGSTTAIAHSTPTASGATGTRTATAGIAGVNIGTLLALPAASTEEWSFGLDAVIQKTIEPTFGINAIFEKTQTPSFGIDAVIDGATPTVEDDFGLDAVLRAEQGATFSLNAVIRRSYEADFGLNAIVLDSRMDGFDLEAILLSPQSGSYGIDAYILNAVQASLGIDAIVLKTIEASFGINAIQKKEIAGDFSLNALLLKVVTGSFGADAIVFKTVEATFGVHAIKKATIEGSFDLDAIFLKTQIDSFGLDAWKLRVFVGSFTANAIVFKTQVADFGLNAVITRGIPFFVRFGNVMAAVIGFSNEYEFTSATSTAEQIAATSSASGYIAGTSSAEEIAASTTYLIERHFGLDAWIEV